MQKVNQESGLLIGTTVHKSAWIDISVSLTGTVPTWPDTPGRTITSTREISRGDDVTESYLQMDVHCGTHVDAPSHFLEGASGVDSLAIEAFNGDVRVVDATVDGAVRDGAITREFVEDSVPLDTCRVLFRTLNSERGLLRQESFVSDFVALSPEAAVALSERHEITLVGNDYLSIQCFGGDRLTHTSLLSQGIAVLEGIDLSEVQPGEYELVALPLRLDDAEAAPVRAFLKPFDR